MQQVQIEVKYQLRVGQKRIELGQTNIKVKNTTQIK